MARALGTVRGGRTLPWSGEAAARLAPIWLILASLILVGAAPALALQATTQPAPRTYTECLRTYLGRTDPAAYCRRLFPTAVPTAYDRCLAASGRSAEARALCAQRNPDGAPAARPPVDVTPQVNRLIEAWNNRPRTPPPSTPADPLAVIPGIQAACARYAGNPERWLRCTADGWRETGLRGEPPVVLTTPPAPPPVLDPPARPEPATQVRPRPTPETPRTETPAPVVEPPVAAETQAPLSSAPPVAPKAADPPPVATPPPASRSAPVPTWVWLVALAAAGAGGFGLSRWLGRSKAPRSMSAAASGAPPRIVLVADPGVVTLTPDGPPRAGMALSMRVARGADVVRLDYPSLEAAP